MLTTLSNSGQGNRSYLKTGKGPGALLAKVDTKHAKRNIPIHLQDKHLLGMQWEGNLYIDTVLPFGLRSAPKIFYSGGRYGRMDNDNVGSIMVPALH